MNVIYKITSPSGKIYIGQSTNYEKRFKQYKSLSKSVIGQPILYRSFKKHGVENHIFEIIEECEFEDLNIRERYWQDFYDVLGENGLNCMLQSTKEKPQKVSKETKEKISKKQKGRIRSKEYKKNISKSKIGEKNGMFGRIGEKSPRYGKKMSSFCKAQILKANSKLVLDLEFGVFYNSIKEASEYYNVEYCTLRDYLSGRCKNKTNLIKV